MSGDIQLTRAKRFKFLHTSHKSQFAGSEVQHVKTTLTASVEGNYTIKADKIAFQDPVAFQSTASIDGNLALGGNLTIGGNLAVTGSVIVTSSVLHKGDNIFGDEAGDLHKFVGTTTASGDMKILSNASIDGTLDVGGAAVLRGTASIDGAIVIGGTASLESTLDVGGAAVLRSTASIDGAMDVGGAGVIRGNASLDGTLDVGGAAVIRSTASIDGALGVGGQLNMNRQKIVAPQNVLRTEKSSVAPPFTGLASQSFPLFRASPGDTVYDQYAKVTIGFASLGVRQGTKMEVGDAANDAGYGLSLSASPLGWKWTIASLKGLYLYNASNISRRKTHTSGTLIYAKITASDMLLASLNAGTVEFYVDVMSRS